MSHALLALNDSMRRSVKDALSGEIEPGGGTALDALRRRIARNARIPHKTNPPPSPAPSPAAKLVDPDEAVVGGE
jgi:hypothetical protein